MKKLNRGLKPLTEDDARWLRSELMKTNRRVPDRADLDDIVQATLHDLCKAVEGNRLRCRPGQTVREALISFSRTVFSRRLADFWRRQNRTEVVSLDALADGQPDAELDQILDLPTSRADSPRRAAEWALLADLLIRAIRTLPRELREMVHLRLCAAGRGEDISDRAIARLVGMSPRGVGKAFARACQAPAMRIIREILLVSVHTTLPFRD